MDKSSVDRTRQALVSMQKYGIGASLSDFGLVEQDVIDAIDALRAEVERLTALIESAPTMQCREAFCGGRVGWIEGSVPERFIGIARILPYSYESNAQVD